MTKKAATRKKATARKTAARKTARPKPAAKPKAARKAGKQGQLGDWLEKIPKDVQEKADDYVDKMRKQNKAKEARDRAHQACLDAMEKAGLEKIRIDELGKWLKVQKKQVLKTEPIKKDVEQAA